MTDSRGALILNEVLPEDIRKKLDEEAQEKDITLNDVAVSILAEHFEVESPLSGRQYRSMADQFKLRVSEHLHWKIRMSAALAGHTVRGTVLATIANHYGLEAIVPTRRPRRLPT